MNVTIEYQIRSVIKKGDNYFVFAQDIKSASTIDLVISENLVESAPHNGEMIYKVLDMDKYPLEEKNYFRNRLLEL